MFYFEKWVEVVGTAVQEEEETTVLGWYYFRWQGRLKAVTIWEEFIGPKSGGGVGGIRRYQDVSGGIRKLNS